MDLWDVKISLSKTYEYVDSFDDKYLAKPGIRITTLAKPQKHNTYYSSDSLLVPEIIRQTIPTTFISESILEIHPYNSIGSFLYAWDLYTDPDYHKLNMNKINQKIVLLNTKQLNHNERLIIGNNGNNLFLPYMDIIRTFDVDTNSVDSVTGEVGYKELIFKDNYITTQKHIVNREENIEKNIVDGIIVHLYQMYFGSSRRIRIMSHILGQLKSGVKDIVLKDRVRKEYPLIMFGFTDGKIIYDNNGENNVTNIWDREFTTDDIEKYDRIFALS